MKADPWELDSSAIFSPWRTVSPKKVLRLGFLEEDPHFPLHPPVLRTLTTTVEKLRKAGHEVVPLKTSVIRDACALAFRIFAMDPAKTAFQHIAASGEPIIPALATTAIPQKNMPFEYAPLTLESLYDLTEQRNRIKDEFRSLMVQSKVDAIIMAGYQSTAVPHDKYGIPSYTTIWNVTDVSTSIYFYYAVLNVCSTQAASFRTERQINKPMRSSFETLIMNLHVSFVFTTSPILTQI